MFHQVAHAAPGRVLFTDWEEAAALWEDLTRHLTGLVALLLMPDHIHAIVQHAQREAVVEAARAYARWLAWHRDSTAPVWARIPEPEPLPGKQHQRRSVRYTHLNPCRARLVSCPLAWPFSTYRDVLGLVRDPVVRRSPDPVGLHSWQSADPTTDREGTPFPALRLADDRPPLQLVAGAVSEWLRVPLPRLATDRRLRPTLLGAARALTTWSAAAIGREFDSHRGTVLRAPTPTTADLDALSRLLADDRTPGLALRDPRLRHPSRARASA